MIAEIPHQPHPRRGERREHGLAEEAQAAHDADALDLEPARGILALDLQVQLDLPAQEVDCLLEREHFLAGELGAEPGAGIERLDLLQRAVANPAVAGRGAVQRLVVDHDHRPVASPLTVELHHVRAELDCAQERRARVLGAVARSAAVRDAQQA